MPDTPRRHPRGRQGNPDEVGASQGAASRPPACPLIEHVLRAARRCRPDNDRVVVGHQADEVQEALAKRPGPALCTAGAAARHRPRAAAGRTGPAERAARSCCCPATSRCCGRETLAALVRRTTSAAAAATVLTAARRAPDGYGRIVRQDGQIAAIVEDKDATPERARDRGDQQRHLRVRSRAAVRRAARNRLGECAGRVLPAGPRADLPGARARRRNGDGWTTRARSWA